MAIRSFVRRRFNGGCKFLANVKTCQIFRLDSTSFTMVNAFTVNAHCFFPFLHRFAFENQSTLIARLLFSPQTFLSVLSLCNVDRVRSCSSLFKPIDSIFFLSLRFYIRRKRACFWSSISFFVEEIRKSVSYAKSSWDRVDVFTILSLVHLQVSLQQVYTATVGDK